MEGMLSVEQIALGITEGQSTPVSAISETISCLIENYCWDVPACVQRGLDSCRAGIEEESWRMHLHQPEVVWLMTRLTVD